MEAVTKGSHSACRCKTQKGDLHLGGNWKQSSGYGTYSLNPGDLRNYRWVHQISPPQYMPLACFACSATSAHWMAWLEGRGWWLF